MTAARLLVASMGAAMVLTGPSPAFADDSPTPVPSASTSHLGGLPFRTAPLVNDITPTPAVTRTPPSVAPKPTHIRPTIGTSVVLTRPNPADSASGCICVATEPAPMRHHVHLPAVKATTLPYTGGFDYAPALASAALLLSAGAALVLASRASRKGHS